MNRSRKAVASKPEKSNLLRLPAPATEQPSPQVGKPAIQKSVLENGIRVVTEKMPGVRSTAIGILVEAGSRHDPDSMPGLAHLCEHLIFQGTSNRNSSEIAQMMDGAGGELSGFTSRDYTCYYAVILDDYGTYALDLLGDLLLNPVFKPETIEREKNTIICEIEGGLDHPSQRAHELLKSKACLNLDSVER